MLLPWEQWYVHLLTVVSACVVVLSAIYMAYRITLPIVFGVLAIAVVVGWLLRPRVRKKSSASKKREAFSIYAILSLIANVAILAILFFVRTDAAIASPWQVVPPVLFVLYGTSAFFLILALKRSTHPLTVIAFALQAIVTWSVSLIIYQLGFGYDPFVHQATERHIALHGYIYPKQPFYIGQYVSVVSLSLVSRLPVAGIDRVLVPLSAIALLPPAFWIALRRGWMQNTKGIGLALIALFLLPVSYFAFTAPFNLALLGFVIVLLFVPLARQPRIRALLIATALCALATHPLIGIPVAIIALVALLPTSRAVPWFVLGLIPAGLMIAFTIYTAMQGALPPWPSVMQFEDALFALFGNPYELPLGSAALAGYYGLLYTWPLILVAVGGYGYARIVKTTPALRPAVRVLVYASVGLVLAAVLVSTFFFFPNIINTEQFEFSLRLLAILPLLYLPGLAVAAHHVITAKLVLHKSVAVIAGIALVLVGAWYAVYPQYNAISYFPSLGMSRGDVEAVRFIEKDANGEPYAVLSHQMMGAAALQEFGFERSVPTALGDRYFYAIPTGGKLYGLYLRLLSEETGPEQPFRDLRAFIHAEHIYVAAPDSWDPEGLVDFRLRPYASSTQRVIDINIYKL